MLVCNSSNNNTARCRFVGANSLVSMRTAFGLFSRNNSLLSVTAVDKAASIPHGLRGGVALAMARSDGGLAAYLTSVGSITANISALGVMDGLAAGVGSISFANLAAGKNMIASIAGVGTLTNASLLAKGNLTCSISIGAQPSAFDIAQAVWEELLTGHTTSGTAAKVLKDRLSRNDYIGLS